MDQKQQTPIERLADELPKAPQTLKQLVRLKQRLKKAHVKDEDRRNGDINHVDQIILGRILLPKRCALPKKKQRELGMLPAVNVPKSGLQIHQQPINL